MNFQTAKMVLLTGIYVIFRIAFVIKMPYFGMDEGVGNGGSFSFFI
jgi:hypothetical protein